MPLHVVIRLPDDRIACADYREPVVKAMRKINSALGQGREPDWADYITVAEWLDEYAEQSAVCHAGLSPSGLPCGHD